MIPEYSDIKNATVAELQGMADHCKVEMAVWRGCPEAREYYGELSKAFDMIRVQLYDEDGNVRQELAA